MLFQLFLNGIIAGSIYSLIALGFTVIYRTVKFFHFAHGVVYAAGAYFAYTFAISLHLPFVIAFFLSVIFAAFLGIGIDRFVYYPLRINKAPSLSFIIASFGVFIFLQNLIALSYGNRILILRTWPIKEGYTILSAIITPTQLMILIISILLMLFLWLFIQKTKIGKAMRAVSDDPLAASVVGINPDKIILTSFAIGSALAGAAGTLIALETNIEPTMGWPAILKGIIASVVGGIGSLQGAVFGSFLLGLAENLGIWKLSSMWKDTISFTILIIFLLIRPRGFFGIKTEKEMV